MLSYGLLVPLIHVLVAAPILIYAGVCLKSAKKCLTGFPELLIGLGLAVGLYHLYNLVVRMGFIENFTRQGGYLGRPVEAFVPFSFPYQKETDRYYSFHDKEHTRNCNCVHNNGNSRCHLTCTCGQTPCVCGCDNVNETFDNVSPVEDSVVRSGHM
jgi:hypothetical protein